MTRKLNFQKKSFEDGCGQNQINSDLGPVQQNFFTVVIDFLTVVKW